MSDKNITMESLPEELQNIFFDYSQKVIEAVNEETRKAGKTARGYVQDNAPVLTGDYKKAISYKSKKPSIGIMQSVLYVRAPHYRLAHLLEKPHALRGGGRSKAQPHFRPAIEKITPEYIRGVRNAIEGVTK